MVKNKKKKLSKKEQKALDKQNANFYNWKKNPNMNLEADKSLNNKKKIVEIPDIITVREFSALLNLPVSKVIAELMKNGVIATINESIDYDTASIIGDELGFEIERKKESEDIVDSDDNLKVNLKPRPPIVVVLGHVDHGKTTLLDAIRKTNVAAQEAGGITQHIGAYQVMWKDKENKKRFITFLDTPGHEAFSAMRAHGTGVTDIAILVVAADDGVKPQTKEAISHAKAAGVPIIVAINKIDKPEADVEKVKRELSEFDLIPEEWGGKTIMVPVSAKQGKNIDELLDIVLTVADLEDIKTSWDKPAEGVVIEAHMQSGMGPVATVIVKAGILKTGQIVVVDGTYGKIRTMEDYQGNRVDKAEPSTPVKISGLGKVVFSGDTFQVVPNERIAKSKIASKNIKIAKMGLAEISEEAKSGNLKELNLIIKADVQGSLEAIKNSLEGVGDKEIKIKILSAAVGDISESDVNMAIASKALIIGFKVNASNAVKKFADEKGIKINIYNVIYNLIDDVIAALEGMLVPEITEEIVGKLEVLKVFYATKSNKIVGGKVIDGKIEDGLNVHLYHSGEKNSEGKIISLKHEKNPVKEVLKGFECGVGIDTEARIKPGDIIEAFRKIEKIRRIK